MLLRKSLGVNKHLFFIRDLIIRDLENRAADKCSFLDSFSIGRKRLPIYFGRSNEFMDSLKD